MTECCIVAIQEGTVRLYDEELELALSGSEDLAMEMVPLT